jgi:hypothetical protein
VSKSLLIALMLFGCDEPGRPTVPATKPAAGECNAPCKPDGSCVSDKLICTRGGVYLGMPMHEPICVPKETP